VIGGHGRTWAGTRIAAILSGAWREPVEAWAGPADDLAAVAPLLLHGGVAALAWRRLRGSDHRLGAPAAALQQAYRLQALRAALHEQEVNRSFTLLRARGVEPVLGKGWAAARLYPDPALRPYGDVDLYVRAEQHADARAAATAPGAGGPIDLHSGFAELDDRNPAQIEAATLHADANGCPVRIFGAEDHLRLLCLHALRHGLLRPLWLCDVGVAVEGRSATFDWDRFLWGERTRTRWAVTAIGLAHRVLGARLDGLPIAERARRLPRWLVPAVLREWGSARRAQGARRPMADTLRHPGTLLQALWERWPNAVEATVGVGGSFSAWPRLPYQVAECARRSARFATGHL
jgi:putative nucleotidyltransferase-like protein